MVRNKDYSLVAKLDGSRAKLTRYEAAFDGVKLAAAELTDSERAIRESFEATLARLAKTRLSSVDEETRVKLMKVEKPGKVVK